MPSSEEWEKKKKKKKKTNPNAVPISHIHLPALNKHHPERQRRVEDEIRDDGVERPELCRLEPGRPVVVEGCAGNCACGESKGKAHVRQCVTLLKTERFQILGARISRVLISVGARGYVR